MNDDHLQTHEDIVSYPVEYDHQNEQPSEQDLQSSQKSDQLITQLNQEKQSKKPLVQGLPTNDDSNQGFQNQIPQNNENSSNQCQEDCLEPPKLIMYSDYSQYYIQLYDEDFCEYHCEQRAYELNENSIQMDYPHISHIDEFRNNDKKNSVENEQNIQQEGDNEQNEIKKQLKNQYHNVGNHLKNMMNERGNKYQRMHIKVYEKYYKLSLMVNQQISQKKKQKQKDSNSKKIQINYGKKFLKQIAQKYPLFVIENLEEVKRRLQNSSLLSRKSCKGKKVRPTPEFCEHYNLPIEWVYNECLWQIYRK